MNRNISADSGIGLPQWNGLPHYGMGQMSQMNLHAYNTVSPIYSVSQTGNFNQGFLPMVYPKSPYHYSDIEIKSYRSDNTSNQGGITTQYDRQRFLNLPRSNPNAGGWPL